MFFELLLHYANAKVIHFFKNVVTKAIFFSFLRLFFSKREKNDGFSIQRPTIFCKFVVEKLWLRCRHLTNIDIALREWYFDVVLTKRIINKFAGT